MLRIVFTIFLFLLFGGAPLLGISQLTIEGSNSQVIEKLPSRDSIIWVKVKNVGEIEFEGVFIKLVDTVLTIGNIKPQKTTEYFTLNNLNILVLNINLTEKKLLKIDCKMGLHKVLCGFGGVQKSPGFYLIELEVKKEKRRKQKKSWIIAHSITPVESKNE